jgi:beta-glucosidase
MDFKTKARAIREQMTVPEKLEYINGMDFMYIRPLWRFGLRGIRMADASMGLRDKTHPATAFPASICLAATWNRDLAWKYGEALAEEFLAANVDVLLGPGVNIYRVPTCGRNFEYLGEDPFLAAELAVPYIQAVQQTGVSATVKHFACNNSDWHRKNWNSIVDERTLHEIYFPAFEAAVKRAGVKAVMTAYNLLNGEYCGENAWLIKTILQERWGFEGLIMSDWTSLFHVEKAVKGGIHLDMPGNLGFQPFMVKALLDDGVITWDEIDEKVDHVLAFALECIERQDRKRGKGVGRCEKHLDVALQVAREGIVLLKNEENILPAKKGMRIGIFGPFADKTPHSGGGAAYVTPVAPVSLKEAVKSVSPESEIVTDLDQLEHCDIALIPAGFSSDIEGEFKDRPFSLPDDQEDLIQKVVRRHKRVIVILLTGGNVDMEKWVDQVEGLIHLWYPGETGCRALAEILFGDVNPSGKLPISLERRFQDNAASTHYLPPGGEIYKETDLGNNYADRNNVEYGETVFLGYRHFDSNGLTPLFPFGFGLSYTDFKFSDLKIHGRQVTCRVTNVGQSSGSETVQLYVAPPESAVRRPVKELKGFEKVSLIPGEAKNVSFVLDDRSFSYFDVVTGDWKLEHGTYRVLIGNSSKTISLEGVCNV